MPEKKMPTPFEASGWKPPSGTDVATQQFKLRLPNGTIVLLDYMEPSGYLVLAEDDD